MEFAVTFEKLGRAHVALPGKFKITNIYRYEPVSISQCYPYNQDL